MDAIVCLWRKKEEGKEKISQTGTDRNVREPGEEENKRMEANDEVLRAGEGSVADSTYVLSKEKGRVRK